MQKYYIPIWPVKLTQDLKPSDKFDAYRSGGRKHAGIDIYNDKGTTVKASLNGIVLRASWHGTYGNIVIIDHTPEIEPGKEKNKDKALRCYVYTVYAHLYTAKTGLLGKKVRQGDTVGTVGDTGNATGMKPHLHFEGVRAQIKLPWNSSENTGVDAYVHRVDPLDFLRGFVLPKECFEASTSKASSGFDRFQRGRFSA